MTPSPRIEALSDGITLHLGDCRDVLPTLGKVDAVVTDPPFSIPHNFGLAKGRSGKGTRVLQWDWDSKMTRDDVVAALLATGTDKSEPPQNPMSADRVRWEHIQRIYEMCNRNVSETARRLNMHRRTLQRILAKRAPR